MNSKTKKNLRAKSATQPTNLSLLKARIKLYDEKLQVLEDTRKAINRRPRIEPDCTLLDSFLVQRLATGSQTLKGRHEIKRQLENTALPLFDVEPALSDLGDTARKHRYSEDLTESFETFGRSKENPEDTRIKKTEPKSPYDSLCLKEQEHFENTYLSPVRQSCGSVLRDDDKENAGRQGLSSKKATEPVNDCFTKGRLEALEVEVLRMKEHSAIEQRQKDQALKEKDAEITLLKQQYELEKSELAEELSRLRTPKHSRSHSRSVLSKKPVNDLELRLKELRYKNHMLAQELATARLDAQGEFDHIYSNLVDENSRLKAQNSDLTAQLKSKTQLVCSKCRACLAADGANKIKLERSGLI